MDTFEAIAEPTRRAVLDLLLEGEHSAGDLVAALNAGTMALKNGSAMVVPTPRKNVRLANACLVMIIASVSL